MTMPGLRDWFDYLSARLRHVRVLNGDWSRLATTGTLYTLPVRQGAGPAGVFLDPPYDVGERQADAYLHDEAGLSDRVREWCLANGDDPKLRIVLAGFDGEHDELEAKGWRVEEWFKAGFLRGGYGNIGGTGVSQMHRDRLWISPHCLTAVEDPQSALF
jgi:DNA adenine methylase